MPGITLDPQLSLKLLKWAFTLGAGIYLVYAFVVFRQISIMKKTLITGFSNKISILGLVNLILASCLFVGFLLFL